MANTTYPYSPKDNFYIGYFSLLLVILTIAVIICALNTWYYSILLSKIPEETTLNETTISSSLWSNGILAVVLFILWIVVGVAIYWYISVAKDPVTVVENILKNEIKKGLKISSANAPPTLS